MNNSTVSSESLLIDAIKYNLLASIGLVTIIMGTIGNFLNILLFTHGNTWRQFPCIPYVLGSSIANIFAIYTTALFRMLLGFQITPLYYNRILCKAVVCIANTSNVISIWFMVGACFYQYFSSSSITARRNIANMHTTKRAVVMIVLISLIMYIEILVCYESGNTVTIAPCANKNAMCGTVNACLGLVFQLITPLLLVIYFSIGTLFNIRQAARLGQVSNTSSVLRRPQATRKSKMANERAILRVVFIQVATFCTCALPIIATKIYQLVPVAGTKSDVRRSAENLVINMCTLMSVLDKAYSFYIYTLASARLRKKLKRLFFSGFRSRQIIPQN